MNAKEALSAAKREVKELKAFVRKLAAQRCDNGPNCGFHRSNWDAYRFLEARKEPKP